MTKPVPPFTRRDAIYFLAEAGQHAAAGAGTDPRMTGKTIIEALNTIGVSHAEIMAAGAMHLNATSSRWDDLPQREKPENV